jgi:AcrR family transcriptional regulator
MSLAFTLIPEVQVARTYDMTNRSRQAAETTERIAASTEALIGEISMSDITLQAIADRAGVTVQTVLRHMGSRDGCFEAVGRRVRARVDEQRGQTEPGDVDGAIVSLLAHYEAEGRLVLTLLAQEDAGDSAAQEAAESGRTYHRAWIERCFGPALPRTDRATIDALVAATDLYVWKLLRLDLQRSPTATQAVVTRLVRAVLETR